jgi:ATP-binding cassette subfamily F protein 3
MLVSHDRALLRAVCDEFWMVSRGGVSPFDGDLDDYQRYLLDEAKRLRAEATAAANAALTVAATPVAATPVAATPMAAAPLLATPVSVAPDKPLVASREQRKDDAQQRKETNEKKRPLKKEQDGIEKTMASLEAEKQSLHDKLASPLAPADIANAGKRLKVVEDELEELELRWLELTAQLETLA